MSFAVALNIIGLDLPDDAPDHFQGGIFSDLLAVWVSVEIDMDAQETLGSF
jgi:hypothetical protein